MLQTVEGIAATSGGPAGDGSRAARPPRLAARARRAGRAVLGAAILGPALAMLAVWQWLDPYEVRAPGDFD